MDPIDPTIPPTHAFGDPNTPLSDPMQGPSGPSGYNDPAFAAVLSSQADPATLQPGVEPAAAPLVDPLTGTQPATVNPDGSPTTVHDPTMPPWAQPSAPAVAPTAPNPGAPAPASTPTGQPGQPAQTATDPNQIPSLSAEHMTQAETPEQKLTRLERQYAASSEEGVRLNAVHKNLATMLKDRGVELQVEKETNEVNLVLAKGTKGPKIPSAKLSYDDLSEADQTLFADDPQAAIDLVLNRANETARTAVLPTAVRAPEPATDAEHEQAQGFLKEMKNPDGSSRFPNWDQYHEPMRQYLESATTDKALKQFVKSNPQIGWEMLYAFAESHQVNLIRMHQSRMNAQQNRMNGSNAVPSFGPVDAGSTQAVGANGQPISAAQLGTEIANAGRDFAH